MQNKTVTLSQFENATLPETFQAFINQLAKVYAFLPTKAALAAFLNIPERSLRAYLSGERTPHKTRMIELEKFTCLSLSKYYTVQPVQQPCSKLDSNDVMLDEAHVMSSFEGKSNSLTRKIAELEAQIEAEPRDKIEAIIKRREAMGLSCVMFAKLAGLNRIAWKRIEDGVPTKNRRNLIRAAATRLDKMEARAPKLQRTG